jgi:hypothetical protein
MYRTGADSLVWSSSAYVSRISRLSRIVAQSHRQTGLATDDETSISLRHNCATGPTANTSSPSSACDYCPPSSSTPGTRNDDLASPPLIPPPPARLRTHLVKRYNTRDRQPSQIGAIAVYAHLHHQPFLPPDPHCTCPLTTYVHTTS